MSCQIRLTGNLQDVEKIRRCLFPADDNRGTDSWLQLCEISFSPTGDVIAVARERKLVILTEKWNSSSNLNEFQVTFSGSVHDYDKVKSVLCLPIVTQNGGSIGHDWTCILIAYDSGYVRFYNENCEFLMEEQFHCENITGVKCQSQHSPRPDLCPELRPEEIYVQYQSVLCVINGPQLFSCLKNSRQRDKIDLPQLAIKKWAYQDQSIINDSSVVGLNLANTFDHLLTASNCGGFETKYRAMPPHNTLVIAAGSKPFLGYHYALEGAPQPVFSDIAKAVTSRIKSALPGWLTGNNANLEKHQISYAMQPSETMGCRFGLCDLRRTATNIILTPDKNLAAITDTLGRVLLVNTRNGVVLKIFKGYRDAQCSFVQVPDEKKTRFKLGDRIAHFLVIYSPKRGTLEVFTCQQGVKIVTFAASKHSKLIYVDHGLMGFTSNSKSKYACQFGTIFLDNDGKIKEISVPFHYALPEKNSKRFKDIHLYKKLKVMLKSGEFHPKSAMEICVELQTSEIKRQTLDMLTTSKIVPAESLLELTLIFQQDSNDDLKSLCENIKKLLELFLFVKNDDENGNLHLEEQKNLQTTLNNKEMNILQKYLDLSTVNDNEIIPENHVKFTDSTFESTDFLSIFNVNSNQKEILLKPNVDTENLFRVSEILFKPYICGEKNNFPDLKTAFVKSSISISNLFDLLINFWVNKSLHINLNLEKEMDNLTWLIRILVDLVEDCGNFWKDVRNFLENSPRPFPALIAAILCKSVQLNLLKDDDENFDESIEILTQENVDWSILIGKLEDVSLLNIVLSSKFVYENEFLRLNQEKVNISLKYVLERGRGAITELVAKWLTGHGVDPMEVLINNENFVIFNKLTLLRQQFPYSMENSNVLGNVAWEYAMAWQKDVQNLGLLEAAIKCLNLVPNQQIKQGLFKLMWNTHLKIVNESACKLINKVGKLPKERLCRQDTGLTDYQISLFISISTDFLNDFLNVAEECLTITKPELTFENIWENCNTPCLIELALQQRDVNFELLHLHYQMSLVMQMMTTFQVKHSKPVNNLFEPSIVNYFFTDLQRKIQINYNKSDIKINSSRMQFLFKIISASLETVSISENGIIYSTDHVKWMSKCVDLAHFWNIDVDILRRYQIYQLYSNGFDLMAEELISTVNNPKELGVQLIKIAIKRMSHFLTSSPDLSENITAISPMLTKQMESMDDDEWCSPSKLVDIKNLTVQILRCLNTDNCQQEYKLSQLLLEACNTLESNCKS